MLLPNDAQDKVRFLVDLYRRVRDEMSDWRERAIGYYRLYESWVDEDSYPLPFKLFYPGPYAIIETLQPRFLHGLLGRYPLMQITKADPFTPDRAVWAANRLLNDKWMTDPSTWATLHGMLKESQIIGMAAGKIAFRRRRRVVREVEPVMLAGMKVAGKVFERSRNVVNRPVLIQRDMFDVYPDLALSGEERRFVFDACVKGMDEIEFGDVEYDRGAIRDLKDLPDWNTDELESHARMRGDEDQDNSSRAVFSPRVLPDRPKHILEVTFREFTREGEVINLLTVANEKVLMRHEIIPAMNWAFFRNNPLPNEFLGRSELQPVERLTHGVNDLLNMNLTNNLASITKMAIIGENGEFDLDQFSLEPFNLIQCADPAAVRFEAWGDGNRRSMDLEQFLLGATQQASGIYDMLRGTAQASATRSPTSVLALQQAAEARIDAKIKWFEKTAISPIARAFIECAQHYLDEPEFVADPSDPNAFEEIDMYSLQGLFDYRVNAASIGIKEMQRQSLTEFMQIAAQVIGPNMPPVLALRLVKAIANLNDGFEEVVTLIDREITNQEQAATAGGGLAGPGPDPGPGAGSPLAGLAEILAGAAPANGAAVGATGGMEPFFPVG